MICRDRWRATGLRPVLVGAHLHKVVIVAPEIPQLGNESINGYLGHQGIRSPDIRAIGRKECTEFVSAS